MIKFFRRIRQKLLFENKFSKYLIYAFGEIFLVVIGILIALGINNWNQKKEEEKAFITTIEQIYTHLHSAEQVETWDIQQSYEQLEICKAMQKNIDSFSNFEILRNAHYLDWIPGTGTRLLNYNDHLNNIEFESNDKEKSSLVFHLNQFFILLLDGLDHDYTNFKTKYFETIFEKNEMPLSSGQVFTNIKNAKYGQKAILSDFAIRKIDSLKRTSQFESALKSTEERLNKIIWALETRKSENGAARKMLLEYYPDINLKYDKITVNGSALPSGKPILMNLKNGKEGIWSTTTVLKDGTINFKSLYANTFSWGAIEEENGNLRIWGKPIKVTKGKYDITVNFDRMTYNIEKK